METAVVFIPGPAWEIALKIQKSGPIPIQLLLDGIQFLNIFNKHPKLILISTYFSTLLGNHWFKTSCHFVVYSCKACF